MGVGERIFLEEMAKRGAQPIAKGLTESGWDGYLKGLLQREGETLARMGHSVDELKRRFAAVSDTGARLTKLEGEIAVTKAGTETARIEGLVDQAEAVIAKMAHRDPEVRKQAKAEADAIFADPVVQQAYVRRQYGQPFQVPVAKAEADHRATIRKLAAAGDDVGLDTLLRSDPAASRQYAEMAGELRWPAALVSKAAPAA